jgi:hypothetical protein
VGLNFKAVSTGPKTSELDVKNKNRSQSSVAYYQNLFDGDDATIYYSSGDCQKQRRKSIRLRTNGIVALTCFKQPFVTNICDIAPGGVSFLYAREQDITNNEFKMDIIIFDCQSDCEYFISQIKGRVRSKNLVADPKSNELSWRFSVEFLDTNSSNQNIFQIFYSLMHSSCVQSQSNL